MCLISLQVRTSVKRLTFDELVDVLVEWLHEVLVEGRENHFVVESFEQTANCLVSLPPWFYAFAVRRNRGDSLFLVVAHSDNAIIESNGGAFFSLPYSTLLRT